MMVRIVTDTTASLTLEEYEQNRITAVPLYVCENGTTTKKEMFEISYDEFYTKIRTGIKFSTSQPDPNAFIKAFQPVIDVGDEVVCITISNGISGTINSANVAKQMMETEKISIIDSLQSGFGQASLCVKAAEMAADGADRQTIVKAVGEMRSRLRVYFMVESLRYLYEGGRLNGAQALIGSIIQIKPIIWFDAQGIMTPLEKVRTLKAAKNRLFELVKERAAFGVEKVGLHYGDNYDEAVEYSKSLEEIIGTKVKLIKLSPVIASHTGPDILGPCIISRQ
jgi:DegV family protein with EDD domain